MKVRLTRPAREDILKVVKGFPLADAHAVTITVQLGNAVASLAKMPRRFQVIGWAGGLCIRKCTSPPYVILFDVRATEVLILRIVHERSDWASLI